MENIAEWSGKLEVESEKLKAESSFNIDQQVIFVDNEIENLELSEELLGDCQNNAVKQSHIQEKLTVFRAIKENLLAIRNIEASGHTLAEQERESGVSFDALAGCFRVFIEDVWLMRQSQKDPNPNVKQREGYEKEVDESLAILVKHRDSPSMKVLGHEGEDYQLNN